MAKSAEYKQQFKEEKKKRKIAYKNKKNAKIARFRFGKNLFIWFIGLITSWVLVAAIVLIGISVPLRVVAPVQNEQNPNGAISEKLGDKTILEVFSALSSGGLGEFSMSDFPIIINAVDDIIQSSGVSNYVNIDKEKLSNLKFTYPEGELDDNGNQKTLATELVNCIEVTATIKISDLFGELEEDSLLQTLLVDLVNTDKIEEEKVEFADITLEHLTDIGKDAFSSIKITTFLEPPTEENQQKNKLIYDILVPSTRPEGVAEGDWTMEDITVSSLDGRIADENIKLNDVVDLDDDLVKILIEITQPKLQDGETDYSNYGNGDENWTSEDLVLGSLSNIDINKLHLNVVLSDIDEESNFRKILAQACEKDFDDVIVGDLVEKDSFDIGKITIDKFVAYNSEKTLCQILCEIYDKNESTYNTITVDNLSEFDLTNVKLSTVIKDAGDNKILNALLSSSTNDVTIGNLGEKINSLSLYQLYGEDCWTTDPLKASNTDAKYSITEDKNGYALDTVNGTHYVSKEAGIWLLVCFDVGEGDINQETGRSIKYTQSEISFSDLSNGNSISTKFTGATLRQLKDAGIVSEGVNPRFDAYTLQFVLTEVLKNK